MFCFHQKAFLKSETVVGLTRILSLKWCKILQCLRNFNYGISVVLNLAPCSFTGCWEVGRSRPERSQRGKEQILIYNAGLHRPNPDEAGPIVHRPMGLPITAGCDTAWNQTRVCRDYSSTEVQCLTPLRHSGALANINELARALEQSASTRPHPTRIWSQMSTVSWCFFLLLAGAFVPNQWGPPTPRCSEQIVPDVGPESKYQ